MPPLFRLQTAISLSLTLLIAGCGAPADQANQIDYNVSSPKESGGTLINAMTGEPSGLISMIAGESASSAISSNIFNSLLKYDKNLELEGDLTQSWQISADQKTITFKLKSNLKWADNQPLTSADVLFTWQAVTNEKNASPYASDFLLVKKAETPDPQTFRVTYEQAYAPALDSWAGLQILPKHLLAGKDLHTTAFARNPVGSHYYKLDSWKHGEHLILSRNANSVLGQAQIDRLITRIIPDNSAQFLELMADNIDLMGLDPIKYSRIIPARPELLKKLALYKELGNSYTYMGFNLKHKPFDDVRVRRAINYAIDKQEIIDGVYLGLGINIASPYKPGTRWSNPSLKPYPYDPAKARALLKEAGFSDSNGDGILERDGKPFSFEIITNQNKEREKSAVLIQRRLKEVGIDVKIRAIEWASFISRFIKTGDFDVVVLGWGLGLDPDQYNIWHSSQQAPGQFNFIGYNNPKVDALLEQGRLELNPDKRMEIYHKFAEILLEDSPIIYLSAGYGLTAIHKRVKGIDDPAPPAGIGHNSQDWYIPQSLRRNEISTQ
ncbi:peptide-binding protein [Methylotenera mobilis]|uniref:Extracellular solute-binding protein family 5 n=1 Tax=Methylotenera mobilis (strain JLW8 / ATCC BAA-1282 / DSM 17540) TaxID=583345 RepID=C6WWB6_METML|nr:peptide-binding protein [Methylotenera mobilis]ACT48215.1 extracellular solute-binding protein family 5 [Methylotenera mobilis JLW8]